MLTALWLLVAQGALGTFDTLYYHEYKLHLPSQPHARHELQLHAFRDFAYALLFLTIGWFTWNGLFAQVMHALMGIVYGLFLACLLPNVYRWMQQPTGFGHVHYGNYAYLSWLLTLMAGVVLASGIRDYLSAHRRAEWPVLFGRKSTS